jgi:hypothetical protein
VRLYEILLACDRDLAVGVREGRCPACGGRLDSSNYPRKPRGGLPDLPPGYGIRLSYCCAEEGCRRRTTPPSVRFLGRKVYLGAVVVLVAAMRQGATPVRLKHLRDLFGVSARTVARWRRWWREAFAESRFWKAARGRFGSCVKTCELPWGLLEVFTGDDCTRVRAVLRFLSPITTASTPEGMAF